MHIYSRFQHRLLMETNIPKKKKNNNESDNVK